MRSIKDAKRQGLIGTTEVTPNHLILTNEVYDSKNQNAIDFITCPPLRTKNDKDKFWKGLNDGIAVNLELISRKGKAYFFTG